MTHSKFQMILLGASIMVLASCTGQDYDTQAAALQSCYDTGFGLKCVSTPGSVDTTARDVNDDGTLDEFVCGDTPSASDSDSDQSGADDSDESSVDDGDDDANESGDADSESDSEDDSESDDDCADSNDDDVSSDDSVSDLDGDGDGDGVSDEIDCDCI